MRNENIKREPEYPRLPGEEGNSAPTLFRMAGAVVLAGAAAFLPLPTLVRTVGFAAAYLFGGGRSSCRLLAEHPARGDL